MLNKISALILLFVLAFTLTACTMITNLFKKSEPEPQSQPVTTNQILEKEASEEGVLENFSGKISDLFTLGKTRRCTISNKDDGKLTGEMFVAENKLRGDFANPFAGDTGEELLAMNTHVMSDGEWFYSWNDELTTGMKMNVEQFKDAETDTDASTSPDQPNLDALNDEYDYKCYSWTVDESKFEVPTNINFVDATAMMENFKDVGCSACNALQGTAQTECKARLGC